MLTDPSVKSAIKRLSLIEFSIDNGQFNTVKDFFINYLGFRLAALNSSLQLITKGSAHIVLRKTLGQGSSISGLGLHVHDLGTDECLSKLTNVSGVEAGDNDLPFKSLSCAGFNFYFTDKQTFQADNLKRLGFLEQAFGISEQNNYFTLAIDHVALCVDPVRASKLRGLLNSEIFNFTPKTPYSLASPINLDVLPFAANSTRINLIVNEFAEQATARPDPYTHMALGTNKPVAFARAIQRAGFEGGLPLSLVQMGGPLMPSASGFSNSYYDETKSLYPYLQPEELEIMKQYGIGYDEKPGDPESCGWQFFAQTPFGLLEGIKRVKGFEFTPRLGEGVTKGIHFGMQVEERTNLPALVA
jgi:4-hydroxyphenylpyruvate dioxygenase-like putative hemolysin